MVMGRIFRQMVAKARWLAFLPLLSCGSIKVSKDMPPADWLNGVSSAGKVIATERVKDRRIQGVPVKEFLMVHSAVVSNGAKPTVRNRLRGNVVSVEVDVPPSGYGSAVSLGDGYFLTAAHVPSDRGGWLTAWERGPKAVAKRYRVVWKGDGDCDLALLHAAVDSPPLPWAVPSEIRKGQAVQSFGYGNGKPTATGGSLIAMQPRRGSAGIFYQVTHSVPLEQGDSGGPLVTPEGKLCGIQSRVDYGWLKLFDRAWVRSQSNAMLPEKAWIDRLIEEDRRR